MDLPQELIVLEYDVKLNSEVEQKERFSLRN